MKRVAVVGGGIAGLTAAYVLGEDPDGEVLVLEGSPRSAASCGSPRSAG